MSKYALLASTLEVFLRSAKICGSLRKMMSGLWMSVKCFKLKTFLLRPSTFHVMALNEADVGRSLAIGSEMDEEASTEVVELS